MTEVCFCFGDGDFGFDKGKKNVAVLENPVNFLSHCNRTSNWSVTFLDPKVGNSSIVCCPL